MAFHVPFSQRPSGQQIQYPPMYIGFEPPRRKRAKFNWWGFNGLFLFFMSLGILSPISLLISLVGLKRRPRRMAVAGTGLSLVGTGILAAVTFSAIHQAEQMQHQRYMAKRQIVVAQEVVVGEQLLAYAAGEFEQYRDDHDGRLPVGVDGNMLAIKHVDPWNNELRYEVDHEFAVLRSAGPDNKFFSDDDLSYQIDGKTDRRALLPIESDIVSD